MNQREIERTLKALANRRRLRIIKYLRTHNRASVGEIADAVKVSFKAASNHLRLLESVDLIEREREGNMVFYNLCSISPPFSHVIKAI